MRSIELIGRLLVLPFSRSIPERLLQDVPGLRFSGLLIISSSLVFSVTASVLLTGTVGLSTPITMPMLLTLLFLLFVRLVEFYGRKLWEVEYQLYDRYLYCFALLFSVFIMISFLAVLLGPILPGIIILFSDLYLLVVSAFVIKVLAEVSLIKSFISLLLGLLSAIPLACYILDLYVNMPYFMERLGA
jgi:hypothetical protein